MKKKYNQKKKPQKKKESGTPNKPHKAHDLFFKAIFSKKREAINLLHNFVEPAIVKGLDLRTLRLENTSYAEPQLKEYLSDLVYSCRWKGKEMQVCLLFEHKSAPVKHPHFQLLRYMVNAWEQHIAQKQSLRPIIPIVVYHGDTKWHYKQLSDYFDIPDDLVLPYLPNFQYELLDLSQFSDKRIENLSKGYYVNTLYLLKYKNKKNHILAHIKEAFIYTESYLSNEEGKAFFKTMLQYLYKTNNFEEEETKYLMENIFKTEISEIDPDNIDNTYDRLLYEGYTKGKREAKEEVKEELEKAKAEEKKAKAEEKKAKAEEKKAKAEAKAAEKKGKKEEKALFAQKTLLKFPDWTDKEVADFVEISIEKVKQIRKDL